MSNVVTLSGAINVGAAGCGGCDDGWVQSMCLAFKGGCCGKPFAVEVMVQARNIASVSPAYTTIADIGAGGSVTAANTLILQTSTRMNVRLTTDDGAGGSVVAVVPVDGLAILEFPSDRYLKLLEIQGPGTVSFFASGAA